MLEIDRLFPGCTDDMRRAFEQAPPTLGKVAAAIDYKTPLEPGDERYVITSNARGEQFENGFYRALGYNRSAGTFDPPHGARHMLFFGHVGCGKSTELAQLARELHHPDRYWVVNVNILALIDPHNLRYSDMWLAVAETLLNKLQADQIPVDPVVTRRFERWFKERVLTHEQIKEYIGEAKSEAELGTGIPFVGKLLSRVTAAIRNGSTYRESLREVVINTYGEFVGALNQLLADLGDKVKQHRKGAAILLLVDGTDRLRGEDWQRLFIDDANALTQVNCVAVYTAPMALKSKVKRSELFRSVVLPMVKLHDLPGTTRRTQAFSAMRAVVLKRCHHSLFADTDVLDALIEGSGGHLRDLLHLLADASMAADGQSIDMAAVDAATNRMAADYRDSLEVDDYPVLVKAAKEPENVGFDDRIAPLLEIGALLQYNSGTWQVPHPAVMRLPGYRRALAAANAAAAVAAFPAAAPPAD